MKVLAFLVAVALSGFAVTATAKSSPHLKVIVPKAPVRSGPGFGFRELYRAERGEVMAVVERNGAYWFRVVLPDGRFGWIYGEQVLPFEVDLGGSGASRAWSRFKGALFAPSPIPSSTVSFAFSGGAIGGDGSFMFRPAVTLDSHFALEAHVGEAIGSDASLLLYGLDANILIWPLGPLVPFLAVGAGGGTSFPKVNSVTQKSDTQVAVDAGGGLMLDPQEAHHPALRFSQLHLPHRQRDQ